MRLALACGVPIVPVVAAGAHSTALVRHGGERIARLLRTERWLRPRRWPLILSVPLGLTFLPSAPYLPPRARITVQVGEPIRFTRSGAAAAGDPGYVRARAPTRSRRRCRRSPTA